jgi:hypothetical protein
MALPCFPGATMPKVLTELSAPVKSPTRFHPHPGPLPEGEGTQDGSQLLPLPLGAGGGEGNEMHAGLNRGTI